MEDEDDLETSSMKERMREQEEKKKSEAEKVEDLKAAMPIEEKVFKVIDLILRLVKDPKLRLKARRPEIKGLGDSESDYDSD